MKSQSRATGPNFLGIGAPRCGSTWLHRMLREHPQVWLPPLKEVHYFDSVDPTVAARSVHRWSTRVREQSIPRLTHYAAAGLGRLGKGFKTPPRPDLTWDASYFAPGGSIDWYRKLFDSKRGRFDRVGEVTPSYFILSSEFIRKIRLETQVDRLVLLLRDPIESLWSGYGRRVREGKNAADPTDVEAVIEEMLGVAIRRRCYFENISRWLEHFPRDQLYIGFYEDLSTAPGRLLDDICRFLGVATISDRLREKLTTRENSSLASRASMPAQFERAVAQRLEPDLRRLAAMLGGPAIDWHRRAVAAADAAAPAI